MSSEWLQDSLCLNLPEKVGELYKAFAASPCLPLCSDPNVFGNKLKVIQCVIRVDKKQISNNTPYSLTILATIYLIHMLRM